MTEPVKIPDAFRAALNGNGGRDMTARLACADWMREHLEAELEAVILEWTTRTGRVPHKLSLKVANGMWLSPKYVGGYNWYPYDFYRVKNGYPSVLRKAKTVARVLRAVVPDRRFVVHEEYDGCCAAAHATVSDALDALVADVFALTASDRAEFFSAELP